RETGRALLHAGERRRAAGTGCAGLAHAAGWLRRAGSRLAVRSRPAGVVAVRPALAGLHPGDALLVRPVIDVDEALADVVAEADVHRLGEGLPDVVAHLADLDAADAQVDGVADVVLRGAIRAARAV